MERRILLLMESTSFNFAPSPGLRGTGLYSLAHCYNKLRWRVEFPFPLPTLSQPQSYPVLSISARIFTIPKLRNIHYWHFIGELSSFFIKDLPNCYCVSPLPFSSYVKRNWSFRDHLSLALPTEKIFYLLRSIRSENLIGDYSAELVLDMLKVIIEWLQVRVSECNRQTPQTKISIYM